MFFATVALTAATMSAVGHAPVTAVTMSPAAVATTSNTAHSTYRIFNTGTADERLSVQVVDLKPIKGTAHGWAVFGEASHYKVSQAHFTLAPKDHKDIIVTIYAPSDQYRHDYGISAQALPGTVNMGMANVSAATVARFSVRPMAVMAPSQAPVAVPQPSSHHAGIPPLAVGGLAAFLIGLCLAARRIIKRRKVT